MALRIRIVRRKRRPRPGFFTLSAEPKMWHDSPLEGYLDYIVFTAKTTSGLHIWHAHKNGNLIADFSALVPEEDAIEMVKDLYRGRTIAVPGRHRLELLQGRFEFSGMERAG